MANEEHLKILKEGVDVWNKWRSANPDVVPDLRDSHLPDANLVGANLVGANLVGANLVGADLVGADLVGADLRHADLDGANLNGADLSGANLTVANLRDADLPDADLRDAVLRHANLGGADLRGADLSNANLGGADLSNANLVGANLVGADLSNVELREADLSGSAMGGTTIGNADLSEVKGLETVHHDFPSTIGIDTIYLSKGNIPEIFLRGVGVPDDFITYMKSLVGKPFDFYSCFISYSSKDEEFAKFLHTHLQAQHVRCWFALEDMKIGSKIRPAVDEAIRIYDKLLLILSRDSINSAWVEKEVETAFEKERRPPPRTVLFPIRLDDAVMDTNQSWAADIRRTRHIGDFRNWKQHDEYKQSFDRLLRDLKAET